MWQFYAIDPNGKLKWKIGEDWSEEMQGHQIDFLGTPIGSDGTLYITTLHGSLRAYTDKSIFAGPDIEIKPASKDFGNVAVGDTATQIFTITNTGKADLVVAEWIILEGPNADQFSIASGGAPFSLASSSSDEVKVLFHPDTTVWASTAYLRITSNDPDENPIIITIVGWNCVPDIEIDPTTLKFGSRNVGSFYDDTIYLSNYGEADLKVTTTSISGPNATDFQIQSGGGPFTLKPYSPSYHYIDIRFSPKSAGEKTASLIINSNDPDENPFVVNLTGQALPTDDVKDRTTSIPLEYKLKQNYPNPFNPKTSIEFQLPNPGLVTLSVFDIQGIEICSLIRSCTYPTGVYSVVWDGIDNQGHKTATGIYFYRLEISPSEKSAAKFVAVKKMILTK